MGESHHPDIRSGSHKGQEHCTGSPGKTFPLRALNGAYRWFSLEHCRSRCRGSNHSVVAQHDITSTRAQLPARKRGRLRRQSSGWPKRNKEWKDFPIRCRTTCVRRCGIDAFSASWKKIALIWAPSESLLDHIRRLPSCRRIDDIAGVFRRRRHEFHCVTSGEIGLETAEV